MADQSAAAAPTVRELRRAWKPTKDRTANEQTHEGIRIRLHRCLSWMDAAERIEAGSHALPAPDDPRAPTRDVADATLVTRWVAFNSLYGRWDPERCETVRDGTAWREFTKRLIDLDRAHGEPVGELLRANRGLLERLVEDEFLRRHFWTSSDGVPTPRGPSRRDRDGLRERLRDGRTTAALDLTIDRVYFLRCQLVHGGASFGSRHNRTAVGYANRFMCLFLPTAAQLIIEHGWDGDWDEICYPPVG